MAVMQFVESEPPSSPKKPFLLCCFNQVVATETVEEPAMTRVKFVVKNSSIAYQYEGLDILDHHHYNPNLTLNIKQRLPFELYGSLDLPKY